MAWRNLADGSALTLGEWHRRSNRLARGLLEQGLGRGDRVGLLIGDEEPLEWLVSYMAIHKAGAVAVPLLARLAPVELARILHDAGASVVLCSEVVDEFRSAVRTVVCTGPGPALRWSDLLSADERDLGVALGPDDVADVMYTSGTTGRPKGVVVRHRGLSTLERVPTAWLGLGFMSCSPFATTSGSLLVCGPLRGGLSGWFLPRFDPDRWIALVERERPVAAFLVPAMVELIVGSPRFATADLGEPGRGQRGQRAHRRRDAAPLRRRSARRGGPGRVRHDRVRRGHGGAPGRRRTAPRVGRAPPPRGGGPHRGRGGRTPPARCGRAGDHRRDASAAVLPGRRRAAPSRRGSTAGS